MKTQTQQRVTTGLLCALAAIACTTTVQARSPLPIDNQEFTDEDFQKFFGLLEDGKITQEKNEQRCADEKIGFTYTGADLQQPGELTRIDYNVTALNMSVDGRPFRSKYRNATFGEWTGQVFKPLCGALYSFTVDFAVRLPKRTDPRDISIKIYLQRAGDTRPGLLVMEAHPSGNSDYATGTASVVLPMATGDELTTWSELSNGKNELLIESVALSGYKISHLPELTGAFDQAAWTADMKAVGSRLGAQMP